MGGRKHGGSRSASAPDAGGRKGPGIGGAPAGRAATPRPPRPGVPAAPSGTDVCALGRAYGQWEQGSAVQRICRGAYAE